MPHEPGHVETDLEALKRISDLISALRGSDTSDTSRLQRFTDPLTAQVLTFDPTTGAIAPAFQNVTTTSPVGEDVRGNITGGVTTTSQQPVFLPKSSSPGSPSFSTNLSLQDPAALQIQRDRLAAEQAAAAAAAEQAASDLVFRMLQESNRVATDASTLELQRDQLALAERQGNRDTAIRVAQLVEQTNSRLDNRLLTLAGMKQQAQIARASITSSEHQASLDRAVQIAGLAENARQFNAQERRLLASEIASAAARPGDVVKQEAMIQAASQGGSGSPISTSIAQGQSAITDASLMPLQMLLDAQGQLGGADSQLAQALANILGQSGSGAAGMIQDPNVQFGAGTGGLDIAALLAALGGVPPRPPMFAPQAAPQAPSGGFQFSPEGTTNTGITSPFSGGRGDVPITESQGGLITQNANQLFQPSEGGPDFDFVIDETGSLVAVPKANKGGVFNIAKVHDGELVVEMPDGDGFAVIPKEQVDKAPSAQEGGVFTGAPSTGLFTNFGDLNDTSQARSFIADALSRVFGRVQQSGLQLPPQITPVAGSTPGTSSGLLQLMAAIASTQSGISPEAFTAEATAIRPRGVPGLLPARRTG